MRVLITGAAGFIGSHLVDAYLSAGNEVLGLDDLSTGSRANLERASAHRRFTFVEGSIADERVVAELLSQVDAVVHLAARIGLKLVVRSALQTIETNADGTKVILRHAAGRRVPTLVASTSEVYGLAEHFPSRETDPLAIGSPTKNRWSYALSKAIDESLALAYHREEGLPAVAVRLFNTVGPRQTAHYGMVIPNFVRQALSGEPLTVYGDGTQTRCFCYVGDVVAALVKLLETPAAQGRVINIGNPQELSILELAHKIVELTHSRSPIAFVPYDQAYEFGFEEIMRRVPSIDLARELIGFAPATPLDTIIREVMEYHRSAATTVAR